MWRIAHFQRRVWGVVTSIFTFIWPSISREEKWDKKRRVIYCANHVSYLDILTCGTYLPGFNFFMAKAELAKVPLFNIWFRTIDIPVNRQSKTQSYEAFLNAQKQFDSGIDMVIFPEGKIPPNAPKLARLKAGAFRMAIERGALIVPVSLLDNHKRFPVDEWVAYPGRMRMHIHRAIDTVGLKIEDEPALREQVFSIIASKLQAEGINQHEN